MNYVFKQRKNIPYYIVIKLFENWLCFVLVFYAWFGLVLNSENKLEPVTCWVSTIY